jgi:hypothetical protein
MNTRDILENYLNQMTEAHKGVAETRDSLLAIALSPFEPLFLKDTQGNTAVSKMTKDQLEEVIGSLENDLLPLFVESKYSEGIDQLKEWAKILQEHLEKQD